MGLSTDAKNSILNGMTGRAQYGFSASTCYIGLGSIEDSIFSEPASTTGYSRTQLGHYQNSGAQMMGAPNGGNIKNSSIIYFPEALSDWGTITHFGLFSSSTASTPFFTGELTTPISIETGYVPIFRVNALSITIN